MRFLSFHRLRLPKQALAAVSLTAQNLCRAGAIVSQKKSFRAGVLTVLGGAITWTAASTVAQHPADAEFNPNSIIDGRSPGAREGGALTQTKPPYRRVAARRPHGVTAPHQRVLAEVRHHGPDIPNEPLGLAAPFAPAVFPVALDAVPGLGLDEALPTPGLPDLGSPFAVVLPGGTVPASPMPVTTVPEVDTWVMLIVGMVILGAVARRRRDVLLASNAL